MMIMITTYYSFIHLGVGDGMLYKVLYVLESKRKLIVLQSRDRCHPKCHPMNSIKYVNMDKFQFLPRIFRPTVMMDHIYLVYAGFIFSLDVEKLEQCGCVGEEDVFIIRLTDTHACIPPVTHSLRVVV